MATAPSPNDLTRQQLDELDALLQKMLTVPIAVDPPPAAAPAPPAMAQPPLPPSWRIDPPQPPDGLGGTKRPAPQPVQAPTTSLAHLSLDDPPLRFDPPSPAPAPAPPKAAKPASAPAPVPQSAPTPAPLTITTAPKVAPAPVPVPKPVAAPPQPPRAVTPAPVVPPVPLVFLPFVALNGLFDNICGMFGPPGRLFRAGFFKQLYGLAGLGLIVYTGLHVAQVQGWLTLPVVLPWPR